MIWRTVPGLDLSYDPLREFGRLHREVNRLFSGYRSQAGEFPEINLWANDEEAVVTAEVPGVDPDQVQVTVANNTVTIAGERKPVEAGEDELFQRRERGTGRFVRSVRLPYDVDPAQIQARARHGVLTIKLPRREESKPRKITIRTE